jgi:hypothetical protein
MCSGGSKDAARESNILWPGGGGVWEVKIAQITAGAGPVMLDTC